MLDETRQKPKSMLAHDPAISGCLEAVNPQNHLQLLFSLTPNAKTAAAEHAKLRELLNSLSIKTIELFSLLDDTDKQKLRTNPNIIFTRDPLITLPWISSFGIVGRMQKPPRAYEPEAISHCLDKLGIQNALYIPDGLSLEGGDVIPVFINGRRVLVIRGGGRTSHETVEFLARHQPAICDEIVEVTCRNNVLHLDSMMGFAGGKIIVYDPNSVTGVKLYSSQQNILLNLEQYLKERGIELLPVSYDEADRLQATNYINIGNDTIIAYSGCGRIIRQLRKRGVTVHEFDGHELAKGRGGPRCLTRPIY